MTVIVGIFCSDGVVLGTDSSATFGATPNQPTIEQKVKKLFLIDDRILLAGTCRLVSVDVHNVGSGMRLRRN